MTAERYTVRRLVTGDVELVRQLNELFGEAFADRETYVADPPSDAYLETLLAKDHVVILAALAGESVVGGLVAYELEKLERARREFYIYDLAVGEAYRRRGIAITLIKLVRDIATRRGAWVVFVQADYGDDPAISLYEKIGRREEVLHFDIMTDDVKST
jgi:aminoglycoside 3-N-acetyltransferase I